MSDLLTDSIFNIRAKNKEKAGKIKRLSKSQMSEREKAKYEGYDFREYRDIDDRTLDEKYPCRPHNWLA